MNSTRLTRFAVSVGMACLILTGNALAGTTTATEVTYAREVATAGLVYTLPVNVNTRLMNIVRGDRAHSVPGSGRCYSPGRSRCVDMARRFSCVKSVEKESMTSGRTCHSIQKTSLF